MVLLGDQQIKILLGIDSVVTGRDLSLLMIQRIHGQAYLWMMASVARMPFFNPFLIAFTKIFSLQNRSGDLIAGAIAS